MKDNLAEKGLDLIEAFIDDMRSNKDQSAETSLILGREENKKEKVALVELSRLNRRCVLCNKITFCEHLCPNLVPGYEPVLVITAYYEEDKIVDESSGKIKYGFYTDDGIKVTSHGSYADLVPLWVLFGVTHVSEAGTRGVHISSFVRRYPLGQFMRQNYE